METAEACGLAKAVVDGDTDQIRGSAVLGAEGGAIMSIVEVAMMGHLPYRRPQNALLAHARPGRTVEQLFQHAGGVTRKLACALASASSTGRRGRGATPARSSSMP